MSRLSKVGVIFLLTLFVGGPLAIAPGALARPSSVLATQRCTPWRIVPVPTDQAEEIAGIDGLSASNFFAPTTGGGAVFLIENTWLSISKLFEPGFTTALVLRTENEELSRSNTARSAR